MKCIEDEIPFEVPEGWEWSRANCISDVRDGTHDTPAYVEKGVPLITSKNLTPAGVDYSNVKYISVEDATQINQRSGVDVGDILFAMIGTIGNPKLVTENTLISIKNVALFKFSYSSDLSHHYILRVLEYLQEQMKENPSGGLQPFVSLNRLRTTLLPIAPITEQNRIVEKLENLLRKVDLINYDCDELDTLIKAVKSKILDLAIRGQLVPQDPNDEPASVLLERIRAEKEELIKAGKIKRDKKESIIFRGEDNSYYETISNNTICIDEEVPFDLPDGWIWCRLKSLATPHENSFVDGPFGSNLKTDHYTNSREVRIIQLNNIGEFTWKNNGIKYTTYSHAETLARCKSYPGDIVIAKMMPAGRAILIPDIEDVYVISSDCVRLQLPNYIDKKYVMYMINSPTINKSVMENVQGIGRTRTSLSKLKELLVPIPPYKQQCQISDTFDKSLFYFDTINALCE